jgi:hypothetical protein
MICKDLIDVDAFTARYFTQAANEVEHPEWLQLL